VTPLDEDSARALIGALVERRLLLLATKTSAAPLAAGLAEQAFESAAEIAEWLVDQESVVDLLASDEDIESALEPAPKTPQVPPPRKLEAASWRWDPEGTSLTVTATTLEGVIEGAREWWDRAVEIASASDDEVDAILCYLEDDGLAAVALFDPEAELEACVTSGETALPESVIESEWRVRCHISPAALGDDDAVVLEEEPTLAMLRRAVGPSPKFALYFWDAEYGGALRSVSPAR